jgi:hypothetical protein
VADGGAQLRKKAQPCRVMMKPHRWNPSKNSSFAKSANIPFLVVEQKFEITTHFAWLDQLRSCSEF